MVRDHVAISCDRLRERVREREREIKDEWRAEK